MMIRKFNFKDLNDVCKIYNYYIGNTIVTLEEEPITTDKMRSRISTVLADYPYLVFEFEGVVVGYDYASQWKMKAGYRYTVETTV